MRMKRAMALKAALLMGAAAIVASPASAAPGTTWTGFYVGASAGYATHQARFEDPDYDWYGSTHQYHQDGAVFGVQGGYNWQTNNVALGIEGDVFGTTIDRDQLFSSDDLVVNEVNWLASLRARKGFAFGDTFLYQTLGVAFGDFDRSWNEAADIPDSWPDLGETKVGLTAGFGVERVVSGPWSARVEAQVLRFFDNTTVNPIGYPLTIDDVIYELRAGVNYSFGPGRAGGGGGFVAGQPFNFAGYYLGGSLGGHLATVQLTDIDFDDYGSTYDLLSESVAATLQGGYNRQINGFVYGLEGNLSIYGGEKDSIQDSGADLDVLIQGGVNWGGNIKFKAGAAADNTLMYIAAGYAFLDYDATRLDIDDGGDLWDVSGTHSGFVVSTGLEHAFTPNLTGRFEAAYTGVGGDTNNSPTDTGLFFRGAAQDVTLMLGANYYFGDRGPLGTGALAPANWAGFYAGAHGSFAYHQGSIFDRTYLDHGGNYTVPSFGGGAGLHAGHDWQSDTFVYGLLADIDFLSNDESDTEEDRAISSSLNWAGTVRGRAGVATGDALFFASAGFAFADAELVHQDLSGPITENFVFEDSRYGWVIGLGTEKKLTDNSSFLFEVTYTKYAEESALNGETCSDGFGPEACEMLGYDDTITVKAGYSFRFGSLGGL